MEKILFYGASVNVLNHEGQSPMHIALQNNKFLQLVKAKGEIFIPFMYNKVDINVNLQDKSGDTVLHKCMKKLQDTMFETVEQILKLGGDCNIVNNAGK
jgi:ankyrin repeat protein